MRIGSRCTAPAVSGAAGAAERQAGAASGASWATAGTSVAAVGARRGRRGGRGDRLRIGEPVHDRPREEEPEHEVRGHALHAVAVHERVRTLDRGVVRAVGEVEPDVPEQHELTARAGQGASRVEAGQGRQLARDQVRADDQADRVEGRMHRGRRVLVGDRDQQVVDRDRRDAARARVDAAERGPGRVDDGQFRGVLDLGPQVLGTLHGPADDPPSGIGIDSYRHRVLAKRAARVPVARPRATHPVVPATRIRSYRRGPRQ